MAPPTEIHGVVAVTTRNSPGEFIDLIVPNADDNVGGWCSDPPRWQPYCGRSWLDPGPAVGQAPSPPESRDDDVD
ncbi:hypothetical protein [Magnetospirillum moscoviense]|uniref:Uncharacterized protein n=1 Tax=Magnetospirillum moscoviense TaxID=1437059 RepID=A0A178MTK1_9PROT|nr:hypothetical protein [Magnetospirillum moscoviense]MBF0324529.1 hypothetical protein [Alphaproteobacteria bacterium]OAN51552.1 hypothetical protein A6A05_01435 [Magnetospirillum moscoviense]